MKIHRPIVVAALALASATPATSTLRPRAPSAAPEARSAVKAPPIRAAGATISPLRGSELAPEEKTLAWLIIGLRQGRGAR